MKIITIINHKLLLVTELICNNPKEKSYSVFVEGNSVMQTHRLAYKNTSALYRSKAISNMYVKNKSNEHEQDGQMITQNLVLSSDG